MEKRKIYLFNSRSRAAVYGIGTYIDQLTNCLKKSKIEFEMINLFSEDKEITITEKDGYRQISIPAVNYTNKNSSQYYTRNLVYLLAEVIPAEKDTLYIFHLNFMTNPQLVASLKKMFKCKVVLVAHYTDWSFSLLGDYRRFKKISAKKKTELDQFEKQILKGVKDDKRMIDKCDGFVCVAQHTLDFFINSCQIDASKSHLINNALVDTHKVLNDVQKLNLRKKYHISEDTKLIFFAGRLDEVKGIAFLIRAFRKTLERHPNAHLFLAGDGNFHQWLTESKDCWSRITFTGRLDKKQLNDLYNIADMGIVSSIHEEFGFVAIEMMMHQLPIIVSNTGGLSEIVEDNVSGLKVPVRTLKQKRYVDVLEMSRKMNLLLDNPAMASRLGQNARDRFLEKYELSLFESRMLDLYQNV